MELISDRDYAAGEAVTAWCGPQPNSRLLLNYGEAGGGSRLLLNYGEAGGGGGAGS